VSREYHKNHQAHTSVRQQHISLRTNAMIGPHIVDAKPCTADIRSLVALIHVWNRLTKRVTTRVYPRTLIYAAYITITECTGVVQPVTLVARTHVTTERVGAMTVLAQVVVFFTLV
jgi:hypothetical protein